MSTKPKGNNVIDLGPTGTAVAANVKKWRERHGLSYAALEKRTEENNRRIPAISLRRIENEARRVDVDELMTLAYALETTPSELLDGGVNGLTGIPDGFVPEEEHRWVTADITDLSKFSLVKYWENQCAKARAELEVAKSRLAEVEAGIRQGGVVNWKERITRINERVAYTQDMADKRASELDD